jgi:long-chain acyl-CoA synthetase
MQTLPEFIQEQLREPRESAFAERRGAPDWTFSSSTHMLDRGGELACALRAAGVEAGDRIVLVSNNRLDWIAADFGILFAGAVVVPVFATIALDQLEYIFKDCAARACFVESPADVERIRAACPSAPRLIHFDGSGADSLTSFEEAGAQTYRAEPSCLADFLGGVDPRALAVLIYTSGTTGNPKGVMLSHDNLVSDAVAAFNYGMTGLERGARALSVLPFAHIYEHTDLLGFLLYHCELYITQPDYLVNDLRSARPAVMALVPRIFERLLAAIIGKAKAQGGLRAVLVPWALGVGRAYMTAQVDSGAVPGVLALQYAVAQKLVLSKIKPTIGLENLAFFVSGSAPLHRDIALTFAGFGIPVCEGYGLTETSPVCTVTRVSEIRYGSVGKPIPGVQIKLASDGEILVKGPNVMLGYYNLPDEHPFTDDGWFATGDIGRIDADGYLFITDRKKELIKTSAGKYVAPARVEAAVRRSIYVAQCFVVGDGRAFPAALVVPNWELVRRQFSIGKDVSTAAVAARKDVRDFMTHEVAQKTSDLASFEQIRRVALLPRDLTIEDGELSPTLKIRRRVVERTYAPLIEAAYA